MSTATTVQTQDEASAGGYWHQVQMENIINRGIQVLVPLDEYAWWHNAKREPGALFAQLLDRATAGV